MKNWILMFCLPLLFMACKSEEALPTEEWDITGMPVPFDLMDEDIIRKQLPVGDAEVRSNVAAQDQNDPMRDGRYWLWKPAEDIQDQRIDGFMQTSAFGTVYLGVRFDPGNPNLAIQEMKRLPRESSKGDQETDRSNLLMIYYEPIEGVGQEAYYSSRLAKIIFRVNPSHLFTLSAEYPLPADQRKQVVTDMALDVIKKIQKRYPK